MRHNARHNKGRPKRPRGRYGYYRANEVSGWPIAKLRGYFLHCVEEVCPEALEDYKLLIPRATEAIREYKDAQRTSEPLEWRHLEAASYRAPSGNTSDELDAFPATAVSALAAFHDGLRAWAETYYLFAGWVLDGAVFRLTLAAEFGQPARLGTGLMTFSVPLSPPALSFSTAGYSGLDSLADFREQVMAKFERVLEDHIDSMVKRLEADPDVVAVPFVQKQQERALCAAALWQTKGDYGGGDFRSIRSALRRVGLTPRPGLTTGKTQ